MSKAKVSLQVRVRTSDGWKFFEPILDVQDRPKKNAYWCTDEDSGERVGRRWLDENDGTYYLDFRSEGKRIRENVGRDRDLAYDLWRRKQAELTAVSRGVGIVQPEAKGPLLDSSVTDYLEEIKASKKPKTFQMYAKGLKYFLASCSKKHTAAVDRSDMLAYSKYLRVEAELAPRTVHNHFANAVSFLKWAGREKVVRKGDWPVYTEEEPETYDTEELTEFFAVCNDDEKRLFQFFLVTGFREQETMYLTWRDVNLKASTVSVTHKPQYKWTPKAYKERSVPVPSTFLKDLVDSKPAKAKLVDLVFPTASGSPDTHMLRSLKRLVRRAGLNCGSCDSCAEQKECERWWLHKFRATFATTCLQNGMDLKTVQSWLGHSDLASTMRYLKAARGAGVQAKVENIWAETLKV